MLQLEVSKWLHKYKWNKFNYASVIDLVSFYYLYSAVAETSS